MPQLADDIWTDWDNPNPPQRCEECMQYDTFLHPHLPECSHSKGDSDE